MSSVADFASQLDRFGLRRLVALVATLAYRGQRFSVDSRGNWVSHQKACTIVSPTPHTMRYSEIEEVVLDNWCHQYAPKPGDTVIDVGAGVGEEAVVFSEMVGPSGRVIAVEAHPETFECLRSTIERSGLRNVTPVHCAIAHDQGEVEIQDTPQHLGNSIMVIGCGGLKVPQWTLDALAARYDVRTVDLLKMNIEGAEKLAVKGMNRLGPHIRNIAISCHDFVAESTGDDSFRSKAEVLDALKRNAFSVVTREPRTGAPWVGDYVYGAR